MDTLLLNKIKEDTTDKIWLAIPEIVDWENTDGFTYKRYKPTDNVTRPGPVVVKDIDLDSWVRTIERDKLTIDNLKSRLIFSISKHLTSVKYLH